MGKRSAFWIGSMALVATLGGVAAYAAFNPALLGPTGLAVTTADPVRRASRIDGDMREVFEKLEKSGTHAAQAKPAQTPLPVGAPATVSTTTAEPPTRLAPAREAVVVAAPSAPVALQKPAKGMPVSLVPAQHRAPSAEAPRVMDPRMTKALDLLANTAPRATVAALPDAASAGQETPVALRPPVGYVPLGVAVVAEKPEAEMTADDLNAREHRRIRQALEGASGGTN